MTDLNDIDTEGTDGIDTITGLIHDQIGDALHNDDELAGKMSDVRMPSSDTVLFDFADGRHVTVKVTIDPRTT